MNEETEKEKKKKNRKRQTDSQTRRQFGTLFDSRHDVFRH